MKTLRELRTSFVVALLLTLTISACGQNIAATITGVVTDSTGAVIAGALVNVWDTDKGIVRRSLRTSAQGDYIAPLLPIGHYRVTAESFGFQREERTGVDLDVNDIRVVNFELRVSTATEQANVEAEHAQVDLRTPAASGVISGAQILALPLNTRNYALLVAQQPGVSANLTSDQLYVGVSGPNGSVSLLNFSVNGNRPDQNNWSLDGADNLDRGKNTTLLTYPSVESIDEFRVLRSNYGPEFSNGSSGQVIVMTRSGTAHYHGSAYEFFRNDALAANNYFNNRDGLPRPPLRYNNFGFALGGPVYIPGVYNNEAQTW